MSVAKHSHSEKEKKATRSRLRRIGGQVAAIERMIDEDRDCTEVLMQVVAARRALKSFAEVVIHEHLHQCIEGAKKPADAQQKLKELLTVLERYIE